MQALSTAAGLLRHGHAACQQPSKFTRSTNTDPSFCACSAKPVGAKGPALVADPVDQLCLPSRGCEQVCPVLRHCVYSVLDVDAYTRLSLMLCPLLRLARLTSIECSKHQSAVSIHLMHMHDSNVGPCAARYGHMPLASRTAWEAARSGHKHDRMCASKDWAEWARLAGSCTAEASSGS